jgi:hypothetical protein
MKIVAATPKYKHRAYVRSAEQTLRGDETMPRLVRSPRRQR